MLEEIDYKFKVTKIDLSKGEQFSDEFRKISPFSKTPVIVDHENSKSIFGELFGMCFLKFLKDN